MAKKGYLKAAVFGLLFMGAAASASAQVTVSGGFALSTATVTSPDFADWDQDDAIGFGGNLLIDFLLPIPIPLSLGFEVGYDAASTSSTDTGDGREIVDEITAIPLLARVAYHFDVAKKLDLFLVGKIGYALGTWKGGTYDWAVEGDYSASDPSGFAWGVDLGISYYFTPRFGIFAEAGFDSYSLKSEISGNWDGGYDEEGVWDEGGSETFDIELPFRRFLTVGFSLKL